MVACVVDRMTRPLQSHVPFISHGRVRAYADKGDFPVPLITPSARHAFLPVASHGATCKGFVYNTTDVSYDLSWIKTLILPGEMSFISADPRESSLSLLSEPSGSLNLYSRSGTGLPL